MILTNEDIQVLAQLERDMDAGTQPYVILEGQRLAVHSANLAEFGLTAGQTISRPIFVAIQRAHLAYLQQEVEDVEAFEQAEITIE
jgi:hypothetical protein